MATMLGTPANGHGTVCRRPGKGHLGGPPSRCRCIVIPWQETLKRRIGIGGLSNRSVEPAWHGNGHQARFPSGHGCPSSTTPPGLALGSRSSQGQSAAWELQSPSYTTTLVRVSLPTGWISTNRSSTPKATARTARHSSGTGTSGRSSARCAIQPDNHDRSPPGGARYAADRP
jgi:hypothetical protein